MVAVGLVFGAFVLVAGLLLAVVVVIWGLLRGRKPQMQFRMNPGSPFGGAARSARPSAAPLADVVDIEAREVPDTAQSLPRDRG